MLWAGESFTFTMSERVTVSMRPLSGTLTISLSHDACEATASADTVTLTTPAKVNSLQPSDDEFNDNDNAQMSTYD